MNHEPSGLPPSSAPLSVDTVLASLAMLDRQTITVRGFLAVQHENHSLAEDHRAEPSRTLWVNFQHPSLGMRHQTILGFDRKMVIATGILQRGRCGHFSACPAKLHLQHLSLA